MRFRVDATELYDSELDSYKLSGGNDEIPSIYSATDDGKLAINSLPDLTGHHIIPLGFEKASDKVEYDLSFKGMNTFTPGTKIYFEDKINNEFMDLTINNNYRFKSTGEGDDERFFIHFYDEAMESNELKSSSIFLSNGYLNIVSMEKSLSQRVSIYNLAGQELIGKYFSNQTNVSLPVNLAPGIYIVNAISGNEIERKKIFIR